MFTKNKKPSFEYKPRDNFFHSLENFESKLLAAIKTGNYHSSVFRNNKVDKYLFKLIKENKIDCNNPELNFWSGMTVFLYITALRVYDDQLSGISGDAKKNSRKIEMRRMSVRGQLSDHGHAYLTQLLDKMRELQIVMADADIMDFILNLPPTEQWLIKLCSVHHDELDGMSRYFPWIGTTTSDDKHQRGRDVVIPSFSIFNYLINKTGGFQLMPSFDAAGFKKLEAMHKINEQPVLLCSAQSSFVKIFSHTNPFSSIMINIASSYFASLITQAERQFLYEILFPVFRQWQVINDDPVFAKFVAKLLERCNDFNFMNIDHLKMPGKRFFQYIFKTMEHAGKSVGMGHDEIIPVILYAAAMHTPVEDVMRDFWLSLCLYIEHEYAIRSHCMTFFRAPLFNILCHGDITNMLPGNPEKNTTHPFGVQLQYMQDLREKFFDKYKDKCRVLSDKDAVDWLQNVSHFPECWQAYLVGHWACMKQKMQNNDVVIPVPRYQ